MDRERFKTMCRFVRRSVKFDTEITCDEIFQRLLKNDQTLKPHECMLYRQQILQFLTGMCGFKKSHRKRNGAFIYVNDLVPFKKPRSLEIAKDSPVMNFYRDLVAGKYAE